MKVLLLIVSCMLIVISLLQGGKTEGLSSNSNLFVNTKERGMEKTISRITLCLIIAFFSLILFINYI